MENKDADKKPELHLAGGKITAEQLAALYERLTGKKPTPEEMEECRRELEDSGEAK